MTLGNLSIDLKDTKIEVEKPKNWLMKLFRGEKILQTESVTQLQYLEQIANVLRELGYKNVLSLGINGGVVYGDESYTKDDLDNAIQLALKQETKKIFHIELEMQEIDGEGTMDVNFYSQHAEGEMPLIINVDIPKTPEETRTLLEKIKVKINEKFLVESGEIEVDEDSFEEDETDEESESEEDSKSPYY